MNDHEKYWQWLSMMHDGELTSQQTDELLDHLKSCQKCQSEQKQLQQLGSLLREWHDEDLSMDAIYKTQRYTDRMLKKGESTMGESFSYHKSTFIVALLCVGFVGGVMFFGWLKPQSELRLTRLNETLKPSHSDQSFSHDSNASMIQEQKQEPIKLVSVEKQKMPKESEAVSALAKAETTPLSAMARRMDTTTIVDKDSSFYDVKQKKLDESGNRSFFSRQNSSRDDMSSRSRSMSAEGISLTGMVSLFDQPVDQFEPDVFVQHYKSHLQIDNTDRVEIELPESAIPIKSRTNFNESYAIINERNFQSSLSEPLSTFSVDVDTAAYSNVRRFLKAGQWPPVDAVRIEEMINYFRYDYPRPNKDQVFSVVTDVGVCPWNPQHHLLKIGLQGYVPDASTLPLSHFVFLIDTSGSMRGEKKLPLLRQSLRHLIQNLRPTERISIVTYSGQARVLLPSTLAKNKQTILNAIDQLRAGGSTAGESGLNLAYQIAKEHFIPEGNNRIILATDGDFNLGASSDAEMVRMIQKERDSGVLLTVLGFGQGNLKDSKMESIAQHGDGQYFYIDSLAEGQKVFGEELGSTLFTIAKDVKLQLEFNPRYVKEYRLIGYENRALQNKDFYDDQKDAGDVGAGHSVTAVYELIPNDNDDQSSTGLKYQQRAMTDHQEWLQLQVRYQSPEDNSVYTLEQAVTPLQPDMKLNGDSAFVAAVVEFGLLLRQSKFRGQADYDRVIDAAQANRGSDFDRRRQEFIDLVRKAKALAPSDKPITEYHFK